MENKNDHKLRETEHPKLFKLKCEKIKFDFELAKRPKFCPGCGKKIETS